MIGFGIQTLAIEERKETRTYRGRSFRTCVKRFFVRVDLKSDRNGKYAWRSLLPHMEKTQFTFASEGDEKGGHENRTIKPVAYRRPGPRVATNLCQTLISQSRF
jgi:hypothetical protein